MCSDFVVGADGEGERDGIDERTLAVLVEPVQAEIDTSPTSVGPRSARSAAAVFGQISIRGVTPTTIVFATKSAPGESLCVGANIDLLTYGRTDASSTAAQATELIRVEVRLS